VYMRVSFAVITIVIVILRETLYSFYRVTVSLPLPLTGEPHRRKKGRRFCQGSFFLLFFFPPSHETVGSILASSKYKIKGRPETLGKGRHAPRGLPGRISSKRFVQVAVGALASCRAHPSARAYSARTRTHPIKGMIPTFRSAISNASFIA